MKIILPAIAAIAFSVNVFAESPGQAAKGELVSEVSGKSLIRPEKSGSRD